MEFIGIILVLCLNLCVVLCGSSVRPVSECSAVNERFMDMFGDYSSSSLPSSSNPVKESSLSVCTMSQESCCTPDMEERFHVEASQDLHDQLQESTSLLSYSFYVNDVQFKSDYNNMLEQARLNMEDIFEEDYNRISGEVSTLLSTFFDDVKDFISREPGALDIPTFVDNFYDNLFPLIYIEELNTGKIKSGLSTSYSNCLARNRKLIRPFGNTPKWTSLSFEDSLIPAKLLLQSMELGIHVINTTNHLKLTEACHYALTRMSFCQYCSGYVDLKPCNALCLNVMAGCFAGLYDVNYDWSRFISTLVRLTSSMSLDRDLERVLRNLPKRTTSALTYLRSNKVDILDKANELCGDPVDVPQNFAVKMLNRLSGERNRDTSNAQSSMYIRINVFAYSLRNSDSFLRSLPNQICFINRGASDFDSRCWTGKRYGNYKKFVWTGGVDQQAQNSEVRLTGREPELQQTQDLSESLQRMRKLILTSLSESGENDASGSGSGCLGDDECEENGSGAFTTSVVPTGKTGGDYVKVTTDTKDTNMIGTTQLVELEDTTTDSDFSFENINDASPTTVKRMTTKDTSTMRPTPTTVKATTERATEKVTSKQTTEKPKPKTTLPFSTNKFIPTKQVTLRAEVDTQLGGGTGVGTRLSVVWTLLMAAAGLVLLL
ncbi:glypican-5-like [Antedon mediterranea]|uniref:glypican-5-like n=1 Tax=Antedon mediterranea TaxID=105859 RepID=UPI003AF64EB7